MVGALLGRFLRVLLRTFVWVACVAVPNIARKLARVALLLARGLARAARALARDLVHSTWEFARELACLVRGLPRMATCAAQALARAATRLDLRLRRRDVSLPRPGAAAWPDASVPPLEQIYPSPGASAETRLVRMGERVGKLALTPAAEERLLVEHRVLGLLAPAGFFPREYGLERVRDGHASGGEALCLREEYVEGESLACYLGRVEAGECRLESLDAIALLAQLLFALSLVHGAGWIHRDLHPRNVIVAPDGRVRVVDFGCAALAEECKRGLHRERIISLGFEPPESASYGPWSPASDVYSACAIGARLLYGEAGVPASDDSPLGCFLRRGTSIPPSCRYPDAGAAYRALAAAVPGLGVAA